MQVPFRRGLNPKEMCRCYRNWANKIPLQAGAPKSYTHQISRSFFYLINPSYMRELKQLSFVALDDHHGYQPDVSCSWDDRPILVKKHGGETCG